MDSTAIAPSWGLDPISVQAYASVLSALGILGVLTSTFIAWKSLAESRKQRLALETEVASRMRPWMALFGITLETFEMPNRPLGSRVTLHFKNYGTLPAQGVQLELYVKPFEKKQEDMENTFSWPDKADKVIVPGEDAYYFRDMHVFAQFNQWRTEKRDLIINGNLSYNYQSSKFSTSIEAVLVFSEDLRHDEDDITIKWKNITVR